MSTQPADDVTCVRRGGIDCGAGPDQDGSVICFDGYREAANRFAFSCREARLRIADVRKKEVENEYAVFVRNSSGIEALSPIVTYSPSRREKRQADGPQKIAGYGVEEFRLKVDSSEPKPDETNLSLGCTNCP